MNMQHFIGGGNPAIRFKGSVRSLPSRFSLLSGLDTRAGAKKINPAGFF